MQGTVERSYIGDNEVADKSPYNVNPTNGLHIEQIQVEFDD